jgi:ABC-type antimicrobial peptide transport system permease subunit
VLAFAVTRRARELAVRVAIGATDRDVIRLITRHTSRLVGIGAAIGVAVTFGLSRIVRAGGGAGSLYDPALLAFVVPVLTLIAIGALASWIPSRRALKINPAIVLRTT